MKNPDLLATCYAKDAWPGGIWYGSPEKENAPSGFLELDGKCTMVLRSGQRLYAPVQKTDGTSWIKEFILSEDGYVPDGEYPVQYFYTHGMEDNGFLVLSSFSQGVDGVYDTARHQETDIFVHRKENSEQKGRGHFAGKTPEKDLYFSVDNALEQVATFRIEDGIFQIEKLLDFKEGDKIRLMPKHPLQDLYFLNTEGSNRIYTLKYDGRSFKVLHTEQMEYLPGSFSGGIAVHDSGSFLAVSLRKQDSLLLYYIEKDGKLCLIEKLQCKAMPRDLLFQSDILYVSCTDDDCIQKYRLKDNHLVLEDEISIHSPVTFQIDSSGQ